MLECLVSRFKIAETWAVKLTPKCGIGEVWCESVWSNISICRLVVVRRSAWSWHVCPPGLVSCPMGHNTSILVHNHIMTIFTPRVITQVQYLNCKSAQITTPPHHHPHMPENWIISYFASIWVILRSIEWMDVNILVAPWTTHSLVSSIATGVHQAMNTGSFRLTFGRIPKKCPSTKITFWSPNRICLLAFLDTFILHRKILFSGLVADISSGLISSCPRNNSVWMVPWSCLSIMS